MSNACRRARARGTLRCALKSRVPRLCPAGRIGACLVKPLLYPMVPDGLWNDARKALRVTSCPGVAPGTIASKAPLTKRARANAASRRPG